MSAFKIPGTTQKTLVSSCFVFLWSLFLFHSTLAPSFLSFRLHTSLVAAHHLRVCSSSSTYSFLTFFAATFHYYFLLFLTPVRLSVFFIIFLCRRSINISLQIKVFKFSKNSNKYNVICKI